MSSLTFSELATLDMYRKCLPKSNLGLSPKDYGMAIQGKRKKKKKKRK